MRTQKFGYPQDRWKKKYERNEAFDCRVYAYATYRLITPMLNKKESDTVTAAPKKRTRRKIKNPFV